MPGSTGELTGGFTDWWLNHPVGNVDWKVPISDWQRIRPVGGYLVGTAGQIEFVPNRFEAMVGGRAWRLPTAQIERIVLEARRLRITAPEGRQIVLITHRAQALRRHLGFLLDPPPAHR
jgi:hypothetical protein